MIVYLSGPIAGYENNNFAAFDEYQKKLESFGHKVVNPLEVPAREHVGDCPTTGYSPGEGDHTSSCCYMSEDIRALLDCDAICFLPGADRSRGARVEAIVAKAIGLAEMTFDHARMDSVARHG